MSAPSHNDLYELARVAALLARRDLALSPGDVADMPCQEAAAVGDLVIGYAAGRVAATFLDGAEGDDLTLLVRDHWTIERRAAVAARGQVTYTRVSSTAGAGTIVAGSRSGTTTDVDGNFVGYVTDLDGPVPGTALTITINATAAIAGKSGNAAAATVTRVLDTIYDTSFTVSNASPMVGGAEEESDEALRERVRKYVKSLRRGTLEALETGALEVEVVRIATAVESSIPGYVTLYVADEDGNSNAAMVALVVTEIRNWRAGGVIVTVVGAVLDNIAVDFSLTCRVGVAAASLIDKCRAAIHSAGNGLVPDQVLYRSLLVTAAKSVAPLDITDVVINTPVANTAPDTGHVIRIPLVGITHS